MSANCFVVLNQEDAQAVLSYSFLGAHGADANGAEAMKAVESVEHFTWNLYQT